MSRWSKLSASRHFLLPHALPFEFGDFFDEALQLLVIVHRLPDAGCPRLGDTELSRFTYATNSAPTTCATSARRKDSIISTPCEDDSRRSRTTLPVSRLSASTCTWIFHCCNDWPCPLPSVRSN